MVTYSLAGKDSSNVTLSVEGEAVSGELPATQGWDNFKTTKLGTLDIRNTGNLQVAINSQMEPGVRIMNLRAIELVPASK